MIIIFALETIHVIYIFTLSNVRLENAHKKIIFHPRASQKLLTDVLCAC